MFTEARGLGSGFSWRIVLLGGAVLGRSSCSGLATGNATTHTAYLFNIMHSIWWLWVLRLDIEVEVASKRGGGECLGAKGALLVFRGRYLGGGMV